MRNLLRLNKLIDFLRTLNMIIYMLKNFLKLNFLKQVEIIPLQDLQTNQRKIEKLKASGNK